MANLEQIRKMMEELGAANENVEEVRQYEDTLWAVAHGEDTVVEMQFDGEQGKLILSSTIGKPEAAIRSAMYEALLMYNFLWHETGGITMALDSPEGEIVQIFALNTSDLGLGTLQTVLDNFVAKALFLETGAGRSPGGCRGSISRD